MRQRPSKPVRKCSRRRGRVGTGCAGGEDRRHRSGWPPQLQQRRRTNRRCRSGSGVPSAHRRAHLRAPCATRRRRAASGDTGAAGCALVCASQCARRAVIHSMHARAPRRMASSPDVLQSDLRYRRIATRRRTGALGIGTRLLHAQRLHGADQPVGDADGLCCSARMLHKSNVPAPFRWACARTRSQNTRGRRALNRAKSWHVRTHARTHARARARALGVPAVDGR